jgi:hypothetical protein
MAITEITAYMTSLGNIHQFKEDAIAEEAEEAEQLQDFVDTFSAIYPEYAIVHEPASWALRDKHEIDPFDCTYFQGRWLDLCEFVYREFCADSKLMVRKIIFET